MRWRASRDEVVMKWWSDGVKDGRVGGRGAGGEDQ